MKLFSKSFFLSLLAIMLFSTGSAMAANFSTAAETVATITSDQACDDLAVCKTNNLCPSSDYTALGVTIKGSGQTDIAVLCKESEATADFNARCITSCKEMKRILSIAEDNLAYSIKLNPMSDAKYDPQDQAFSRAMCHALKVVTGSAGKTFAAFAIIATGIGFFTGKVSWGLMIGVTAGIATMFGAPSIVAAISGQDTTMNCGAITK
jgi:type IV secretory pathway VirB2 component (pilin)